MQLQLKIEVNFNPTTSRIIARDVTGFYNALSNPTGYGVPNLARNQIHSAKIILFYNNKTVLVKDVTSVIRNSITGTVDFGELDFNVDNDGVYKVFLWVDSYNDGKLIFITENIKRQMAEYWVVLADNHNIFAQEKLQKECIWLGANIQGLDALEKRGLEAEFIHLLTVLERRFLVNKKLFI